MSVAQTPRSTDPYTDGFNLPTVEGLVQASRTKAGLLAAAWLTGWQCLVETCLHEDLGASRGNAKQSNAVISSLLFPAPSRLPSLLQSPSSTLLSMCSTINFLCSPVFFSTETDGHAGNSFSSSDASSIKSNTSSNNSNSSSANGALTRTDSGTHASVRDSSNQGPSKSGLTARLAAASSSSRIVRGLGGVPATDRPILFVGNHQTYAPDLPILIQAMLKEGIPLRGLTHPIALGMVRHRMHAARLVVLIKA